MEVDFIYMSYLALYRKYRPVDFDDVYGQEEVVTVIKNAIANGKVSHAYLFSGPRGTGKTTVAKIIARLVNCEHLVDSKPCGKCYNCLNFNNSNDIVEIDAASNNGVDEIRELRDKINLVPSNAKYKVYIIDEVHMLTNQAFNALLKTLEEPPSHVIFILATTEPSKIPLTISSRCQKFRFSKISDNKIVDRLKDIVKLENINIDNDALFEIARVSDGGMRDSINMLDQLISYSNSKITLSDVYAVNGSVSYDELFTLINDIYNNDKVDIINFVDKLDNEGKEIIKFLQELLIFLKDVILYKNAKILSNIEIKNDYIIKTSKLYSDNLLYDLIENLNDVQNAIKSSTHGSIIFMTFILKFSDAIYNNGDNSDNNTIKIDETVEKNNAGENNKKEKNISREIKKVGNIQKMSDDEINVRVNNALATASKGVLNNFKNNWSKIDDYLTDEKFSVVSGLLKDFVPVVASEKYVIVASDLISMVDRINDDIIDVEMFFRKLFDFNIFVVAITTDRWKDEKNKYVSNIKNGIKYYVKELNKSNVDETKNNNPVDELIDLLGDSVIEYK